MVTCTPTKKAHIYQMHNEGLKFTEITNTLGLHPTVVSCNFYTLKEQGPQPDFHAKATMPGQPHAISPCLEQNAVCAINSGKCCDATDVQHKLFPHLHLSTVCQMFVRKGSNGRVHWKKPWLSKKHIYVHKHWAELYHKRREFFWQKVWYSDESKFNLFGSDGKSYCRR